MPQSSCAGKGRISVYVLIAFHVVGSQGDRISVHYLGHEGKDSSNLPHLHPFSTVRLYQGRETTKTSASLRDILVTPECPFLYFLYKTIGKKCLDTAI